jgi:hypothetical protein
MNSRVLLFLLSYALIPTVHAQELAPELIPLEAKYKADTAALETQKAVEIARLAQVYGASLDVVEKTETAAGHLPAITAIMQERGDLKKGGVKAELFERSPEGRANPS